MRCGIALIVALTILPLSGCGTFCNFAGAPFQSEGGPRLPAVYGGVQMDVAVMMSDKQLFSFEGMQGPAGAIFLGCLLAELPASFVADTLTLPITLCIDRWRYNAETRPSSDLEPRPAATGPSPSTAFANFNPSSANDESSP
jgi:uncharacterized protein YceK